MSRWLLTLGGVAVASGLAWVVAGRVLEGRARSDVADRWVDLELCLLGPGVHSGARPSARLHAIALGPEASEGWPARCAPPARALDDALSAPPVRAEFANVPRLSPALTATPSVRDEAVDRAFSLLRSARLPPGNPSWSGETPRTVTTKLTVDSLLPTATGLSIESIALGSVASDGVPRLLLPGSVQRWCRLALSDEGSDTELRCRSVGVRFDGEVRFPWTDSGAPELLVGSVDGVMSLIDVASGARLFTPASLDSDVFVGARGDATLLQRLPRSEGERAAGWEFRHLLPGQAEERLPLDLPSDAGAIGLSTGVAWWEPRRGDTPLYFARFERKRAQERFTIGRWEPPNRVVDRCLYAESRAIVVEASTRTAVLHGSGRTFRVDELPSGGALACYDGKLRWFLSGKGRAEHHVCTRDGCRGEVMPTPDAVEVAVAPVGESLAVVWLDANGIARSALLDPSGQLREEAVLFEGAAHGGLAVRRMRGFGGSRHAVFFLEDPKGRVYAVGVSRRGDPSAVPLRPW